MRTTQPLVQPEEATQRSPLNGSRMHDASTRTAVDIGEVVTAEEEPARVRRTVWAIVGVLAYQGFTMAINGIGSPWIAQSFHLDQSGIAALFACISVSSLGSLALARLVDRVGRRRVVLWCMVATPLCALGAALASGLIAFALFEILLYAFIAAAVSGSVVMLAEALPIAQRAKGQSYGGLAVGLGGGLCVILMPFLVEHGYSWRWLLVLSASGIIGLPLVR